MSYTLRPLGQFNGREYLAVVGDGEDIGTVRRYLSSSHWQAYRGVAQHAFPILSDGTMHGSACAVVAMWQASPAFASV